MLQTFTTVFSVFCQSNFGLFLDTANMSLTFVKFNEFEPTKRTLEHLLMYTKH